MATPNTEKFEAIRDHLNRADLSNSEQFDRAILTLSTAGLGFSIALVKFVFPLTVAEQTWLLMASWICFGASIVLTVVSFLTTRGAISDTRTYAYRYYIEDDAAAGSEISPYSRATYFLNLISGTLFVIAIALTIAFASINLNSEPNMSNDNRIEEPGEKKGYVPPPADSGGKSEPKPEPIPDPPKDSPKPSEGES